MSQDMSYIVFLSYDNQTYHLTLSDAYAYLYHLLLCN